MVVHPTNRKWVTTLVINGISGVSPLITGVITHLLSGMNHQVVVNHTPGTELMVYNHSRHGEDLHGTMTHCLRAGGATSHMARVPSITASKVCLECWGWSNKGQIGTLGKTQTKRGWLRFFNEFWNVWWLIWFCWLLPFYDLTVLLWKLRLKQAVKHGTK